MFLGAAMLLQVQGCYGQFALTRKLYAWNGTVGDKWVKSIVMFALCVIPVYELAGFADWALLNTIQFWTGKSPVVLKEGEKEIQMVEYKGNQYRLTATTNRLDVQTDRGWEARSAGKPALRRPHPVLGRERFGSAHHAHGDAGRGWADGRRNLS